MRTSAPRDTAHKWLAFGAIVVVAVGTSFASRAFKNHLRESLPQPDPPSPMPLGTGDPSPPPSPPPDPDEDAPAADDPRVAPKATTQESERARPAWWASQDGSWAPMHSRATELFAAAAMPSGDLKKAFVMCRGRTTTAEQEDVRVRATFGKLPEIAADGPKQGDYAIVTAPLVDLKTGDSAEVVVSTHEDGGFRERTRANVVYAGTISADDTDAELDCAALTGDDLQEQIAIDAGRADSAIARFRATKLDPAMTSWGHPAKDALIAQRRIADVAALVGWSDARVTKRVAAYADAVKTLDAEKARIFEELHGHATDTAKVGAVTFTLSSYTCDPQPSRDARCVVALSVKNEGTTPLVWGRDVVVSVAEANGPHHAPPPEGEREETVAPQATRTLKVMTGWRAQPPPAVAQIGVGFVSGVIKLR